MAQLFVREVSEDTVRRLKERAKAHGRSVEAEHRVILEAAVKPPLTTPEWLAGLQELSGLASSIRTSFAIARTIGREFATSGGSLRCRFLLDTTVMVDV